MRRNIEKAVRPAAYLQHPVQALSLALARPRPPVYARPDYLPAYLQEVSDMEETAHGPRPCTSHHLWGHSRAAGTDDCRSPLAGTHCIEPSTRACTLAYLHQRLLPIRQEHIAGAAAQRAACGGMKRKVSGRRTVKLQARPSGSRPANLSLALRLLPASPASVLPHLPAPPRPWPALALPPGRWWPRRRGRREAARPAGRATWGRGGDKKAR